MARLVFNWPEHARYVDLTPSLLSEAPAPTVSGLTMPLVAHSPSVERPGMSLPLVPVLLRLSLRNWRITVQRRL